MLNEDSCCGNTAWRSAWTGNSYGGSKLLVAPSTKGNGEPLKMFELRRDELQLDRLEERVEKEKGTEKKKEINPSGVGTR